MTARSSDSDRGRTSASRGFPASRRPLGHVLLTRWILRPSLPAKIILIAACGALAYAAFQGFSESYKGEGDAAMRPLYGGLFALGVFGVGFIASRRPPRRLD